MPRALDVFFQFLRLGTTSFGGPVAHLAYLRRAFVEREAWLDDATFGECVALTQLLPGPGSSQTGILIGWLRAGPAGAFAAWAGFTLPSAALMTLIAEAQLRVSAASGWMHGLLLVAAGTVASAIVAMRRALAPDLPRLGLAIGVAAATLCVARSFLAPVAIAAAALAGAVLLRGRIPIAQPQVNLRVTRAAGALVLAAFAVSAFALFAWWNVTGSRLALLAGTLFSVGSLVFGGGHVVLPLMQSQLATAGIISQSDLLAGYAAAQAMPGPLFSISAYAGDRAFGGSLGWTGALTGTLAIFAPSFFLLAGIAPFYRMLAANEVFRCAIAGANAGVLGLLAAAFVSPIFVTSIRSIPDGVVALAAFAAVTYAKAPAWLIVLLGALAGYALEK
jgi:chromate transporter